MMKKDPSEVLRDLDSKLSFAEADLGRLAAGVRAL
jgi:hypothetical protein